MASYVVHYIAGEQFLKSLNKIRKLNKNEVNKFRLGNLIVDFVNIKQPDVDGLSDDEIIKIKERYRIEKTSRKLVTHFRDKENIEFIFNLPNLERFIDKYNDLLIKDFSVLGYLFHLYTDKIFFETLFSDVITCLDANKQPTNLSRECKYVLINKSNKLVLNSEFWSGNNSIYNDYDRLNVFLINKYDIDFDKDELIEFALADFINPGIDEVNYKDVSSVIEKMDGFIRNSRLLSGDLCIFDEGYILEFISYCSDSFMEKYGDIIYKLAG